MNQKRKRLVDAKATGSYEYHIHGKAEVAESLNATLALMLLREVAAYDLEGVERRS
ncbi:hypothetical protein [Virgibacillus ainsalahensis]